LPLHLALDVLRYRRLRLLQGDPPPLPRLPRLPRPPRTDRAPWPRPRVAPSCVSLPPAAPTTGKASRAHPPRASPPPPALAAAAPAVPAVTPPPPLPEPAAAPRPPSPPSLPPPRPLPPPEPAPLRADGPFLDLPVEGFGDAFVSLPLGASDKRPVLVATHGNYD